MIQAGNKISFPKALQIQIIEESHKEPFVVPCSYEVLASPVR